MINSPPRSLRVALCLAATAGLLATASPVSAEWFAELYGGVAYTPRSDVTLVVRPPSGPADHTFHDVKWDRSATVGGRVGYWLESTPWFGIGLDAFYFRSNIPTQTVSTTILGATTPVTLQAIDVSNTAIAFDVVRVRFPLQVSPEFPDGRLKPYVAAGPALFWTRAKNTANAELSTQTATDSSWGFKVGAGLSWQIVKNVAIFGEFRYTHVRAEPVFNSASSSLQVPLQIDLNTQYLLGGVSFRF